jgi:hypothetical protein
MLRGLLGRRRPPVVVMAVLLGVLALGAGILIGLPAPHGRGPHPVHAAITRTPLPLAVTAKSRAVRTKSAQRRPGMRFPPGRARTVMPLA